MEELVTVASHGRIVQYLALASTTVFFYDFTLTLPSEIRFMWSSWGGWLGKFVFFYTRYSPVIGSPILLAELVAPNLSTNVCKFTRVTGVFLSFTLGLSTTAIFCLRMCTIYQKTRRIVIFITTFYFASAVLQTAISLMALAFITPLTGSLNGRCTIMGEIPRNLHKIIAGSYLSLMPCETIILIATVAHSIQTRNLNLLNGGSTTLPILKRLYRDGMPYFLLALFCRLCGAIMWLAAPAQLKPAADYSVYPLTSIASYRFFIALRRSISRTQIVRSEPLTTNANDTFDMPERPPLDTHRLSIYGTTRTYMGETDVDSL